MVDALALMLEAGARGSGRTSPDIAVGVNE